jgi:hypothetical protein
MDFFAACYLETKEWNDAETVAGVAKSGTVLCAVVVGESHEVDPAARGGFGHRPGARVEISAGAQTGVVMQVRPNSHDEGQYGGLAQQGVEPSGNLVLIILGGVDRYLLLLGCLDHLIGYGATIANDNRRTAC